MYHVPYIGTELRISHRLEGHESGAKLDTRPKCTIRFYPTEPMETEAECDLVDSYSCIDNGKT